MRIIDFHVHLGELLCDKGSSAAYRQVPWPMGWYDETGAGSVRKISRAGNQTLKPTELECHELAVLPELLRQAMSSRIGVCVLQPIEPVRDTADNLALIAEYKTSWRMMLSSSFSIEKIRDEGGVRKAAAELAENAEPPVTIKTFASVHPLDHEKERKLISYNSQGVLGLKLHPIIQDLPPEDPAWMDTLEIWARTGKPVLVHSGSAGLKKPLSDRDSYGEAGRLKGWIEAFPDTVFVLAHLNMMNPQAVYDLARNHDNVMADVSFHGPAKIREARDQMGAERLVFASDFPFTLQRYALRASMEATEDDPEFRSLLFHGNAERLLGI